MKEIALAVVGGAVALSFILSYADPSTTARTPSNDDRSEIHSVIAKSFGRQWACRGMTAGNLAYTNLKSFTEIYWEQSGLPRRELYELFDAIESELENVHIPQPHHDWMVALEQESDCSAVYDENDYEIRRVLAKLQR